VTPVMLGQGFIITLYADFRLKKGLLYE